MSPSTKVKKEKNDRALNKDFSHSSRLSRLSDSELLSVVNQQAF